MLKHVTLFSKETYFAQNMASIIYPSTLIKLILQIHNLLACSPFKLIKL